MMYVRMMSPETAAAGAATNESLIDHEVGPDAAAAADDTPEVDPDDEEVPDDELYGEEEPAWIKAMAEARGQPRFARKLLKDPDVAQAAWKLRSGFRERIGKVSEREAAIEARELAHKKAEASFKTQERAFYEFFRQQGATKAEAKAEANSAAKAATDPAKGAGGGGAPAVDIEALLDARFQKFSEGMTARADEIAAEQAKADRAERYAAAKVRLEGFAKANPDFPAMRATITEMAKQDVADGKKPRPAEHYYYILKGEGKGGSTAVAGGADKAAALNARTATAKAQAGGGGAPAATAKFNHKMSAEERAEVLADPKQRAAYAEWLQTQHDKMFGS